MLRSACGVMLSITSLGCAAPEHPKTTAPHAVEVAVPETKDESAHVERSPTSGRIEGVFLVDDGVLVTLDADELGSIARCHHAGRPFGWALLSVGADKTVTLVEAEANVTEAANCARSSLSLHTPTGEVLIYLRFL